VVSVIVPNYNHAPYLKERIESVLGQDYPDMEVILLDDGSTDESAAIMQAYATDARVKGIVKGKENSGNPFVQWRKGIEMAEGKYIWIAESDDVAEKDLVSTLITPMERDEEIIVSFCQSRWIDSNGKALRSTVYRGWGKDKVIDGETFIRKHLLGYCFICNASAVVMRREAALGVSQQCEQYSASGDRQFWIEMAQQGKVHYCAKVCNAFRQHPNKVSGKAAQQGINTREDYAIYEDYVHAHPISRWHKIRICLYHLRASVMGNVEKEARRANIQLWRKTWRE